MKTTTTIKVGGRERKLAFDFNAMAYLDEQGGVNVFDGLDFSEFRRPAKMLLLITAMLQTDAIDHGEELTKEKVGAMLDLATMREFTEKMEEVVERSIPDEDGAHRPPEARDG